MVLFIRDIDNSAVDTAPAAAAAVATTTTTTTTTAPAEPRASKKRRRDAPLAPIDTTVTSIVAIEAATDKSDASVLLIDSNTSGGSALTALAGDIHAAATATTAASSREREQRPLQRKQHKQRQRRRRRRSSGASSANTDDGDAEIDAMLEELGIPNSDKKKRQQQQQKQQQREVIELLTPPRAHQQLQQQREAAQSVVTAVRTGVRDVVTVDMALELSDTDDDDAARSEPAQAQQSPLRRMPSATRRVTAIAVQTPDASAAAAADASVVDLTSPDQASRVAADAVATDVRAQQRAMLLVPSLSVAPLPAIDVRLAHRASNAILAASPHENDVGVTAIASSQRQRQTQLLSDSDSEADSECDALLSDLLLARPLTERIAAARERVATRALHESDLLPPSLCGSDAPRLSSTRADAAIAPSMASSGVSATSTAPARSQSKSQSKSQSHHKRASHVAVVRLERALDASAAGDALKTALETHVHSGRALTVQLAAPIDCALANAIQWQWRDAQGVASVVAAALYLEASAFVELLQRGGYSHVRQVVETLQRELLVLSASGASESLLPSANGSDAPAFAGTTATTTTTRESLLRTFVIVEGLDKCLITQTKQRRAAAAAAFDAGSVQQTPLLSFSDVHEMAFQLFMDTDAHTQFTVDLDDTAAYVALLTRELTLAAAEAARTAATDALATQRHALLTNVPRLRSIRVTARGATRNAFATAWLRMLQLVPGVSEDRAQRVLDRFPTLATLLHAYEQASDRDSNNTAAQEQLLATALADKRVSLALSRRLFRVFCVDDPHALI